MKGFIRVLLGVGVVGAAAVALTAVAGAGSPSVNAELAKARAATAKYHSFARAEADGYTVVGEPCVASPAGTMGIHAINPPLLADDAIDPLRPEILLYVRGENGELRLIGLEYWKADADQNLSTTGDRPSLFGVPFDGPMEGHNPFMPRHYDLHVWIWAHNPSGMFSQWNPRLHC
ncbi:MAG TPA: hypothetical protein VE440_08055 [Gaiellaceae bacterium]|jgi:hypothetical protein|nr:hypothetical protein [Gaiellaceae bacterium]